MDKNSSGHRIAPTCKCRRRHERCWSEHDPLLLVVMQSHPNPSCEGKPQRSSPKRVGDSSTAILTASTQRGRAYIGVEKVRHPRAVTVGGGQADGVWSSVHRCFFCFFYSFPRWIAPFSRLGTVETVLSGGLRPEFHRLRSANWGFYRCCAADTTFGANLYRGTWLGPPRPRNGPL